MLNRRDDSWPKDVYFLFCIKASIFRHKAQSNVQFRLRGRTSEATAEDLSRIMKDDLLTFVAELQLGKRKSAAPNAHPGMHTLLRTLQTVSHNATWTDHSKYDARTQAISMMVVLCQPFCWLTINPSDINIPLVMHYGGHNINLASACHRKCPST